MWRGRGGGGGGGVLQFRRVCVQNVNWDGFDTYTLRPGGMCVPRIGWLRQKVVVNQLFLGAYSFGRVKFGDNKSQLNETRGDSRYTSFSTTSNIYI